DSLRKYFEAYHVSLKLTMLSVEAPSPLHSARQYSGSSSSPMSPSPSRRSPKFLRWKDIEEQAEAGQTQVEQTQIEQTQIDPAEALRRESRSMRKPPLSPAFGRVASDEPIPGLILTTPKKRESRFDFSLQMNGTGRHASPV